MKRMSVIFRDGRKVYVVDGRELTEAEAEAYWPSKRGRDAGLPAFGLGPDFGWERENGGRGRYIAQIANRPGDSFAYCRSQQEAMDKAKTRFQHVEKA